jgi:hypothetical protein
MDVVSTASTSTYLASLDAALVGPRRVKNGLLQEARDHLDDASAAYVRAGYDDGHAAALAVADFGTVDEVAPGFQSTLAVASARRTALLLVGALAIQPFVWDGPVNPNHGSPDGVLYAILDVGVEVFGGLALATAVVLLLAGGIGRRWIGDGRLLARVTALVTLASTVSIKLSGLAMTLVSVGHLAPAHWLLLVGCLLVPMSLAGASARRTLQTC